MSSLLQFNGRVDTRGVHLKFVQIEKQNVQVSEKVSYQRDVDTDGFYANGKWYARVWTCPRKPRGMFGPWVVFMYNGEEQVPDLSVPISVTKLPRDAHPLSIEECLKYWHS
jgi:hypothetical protein